ncbi:MAG: hypothetical protein LYZ69_00795 [Nitrososphaerales archaeon]|nr:hypothetical protein [Nitrososphaerales archaeon]
MAERDEVKLLIAVGVAASIVAYYTLRSSASLPFPLKIPSPDPLGIDQDINFTLGGLILIFSAYVSVLAFAYSWDFFIPLTENHLKFRDFESAVRSVANAEFLVAVGVLIVLYIEVLFRIVEPA